MVRYVVYSIEWGVYLGPHTWSFNDGPLPGFAPSFSDEVSLNAFRTGNGIEVIPDLPGGHVSKQECARVGLPVW